MTVDRFGLYRAEDGEHVALVNVGQENPLEMQDVVSTTEKLKPLAEATGGTVRRIAAGAGDAIVMPRVVGLNPRRAMAAATTSGSSGPDRAN